MWITDLIPPWSFESTVDTVLDSDHMLFLADNHRCLPQFLQPHVWLLQLLEIIISVLSIFLNGISGVSTFYATAIPPSIRRTFAIISLNYAFLAATCLAKKCFLIMSIYYPCITVSTALSCKLQEFPTVLIYFHSALLPLTLATQMLCFRRTATGRVFNGNHPRKRHIDDHDEFALGTSDWTRWCSVHESVVLIICVCLSIYFTVFDPNFNVRLLKKCSILIVLKERGMAFMMLTVLTAFHLLATAIWPLVAIGQQFEEEKHELSCCKSPISSISPPPSILLSPSTSKPIVQQIAKSCKIVMHSRSNLWSKSTNKLPAIAEEGASSPAISNSTVPLFDPPAMNEKDRTVRHYVHVGEWQPRRGVCVENDAEFRQNIALNYLKLSFRDVLLYESIFWLISLLLAGSTLFYQYVARRSCSTCIFLAIELSFTLFPLLISLSHSPLCIWLVMPIRQASVRIFPTLLGSMLPSMEPKTPPLPCLTGDTSSKEVDDYPSSSVRIMVTRYDGGGSPSSTTSILSGKAHC